MPKKEPLEIKISSGSFLSSACKVYRTVTARVVVEIFSKLLSVTTPTLRVITAPRAAVAGMV